jgi:hypothetical protein
MGREIRMVPPNWVHPMIEDRHTGRLREQPMYDRTFAQAEAEWLADFDRVRRGDMDDIERECYPHGVCEWACDNTPPDPAYYRPWSDEEATWFQVWQTVSEGTPVSPPFATKEELIAYLAEHGDFWDQKRCHQPDWKRLYGGEPGVSGWGETQAARFVNGPGWSPSLAVADGKVMDGIKLLSME